MKTEEIENYLKKLNKEDKEKFYKEIKHNFALVDEINKYLEGKSFQGTFVNYSNISLNIYYLDLQRYKFKFDYTCYMMDILLNDYQIESKLLHNGVIKFETLNLEDEDLLNDENFVNDIKQLIIAFNEKELLEATTKEFNQTKKIKRKI